MFYLITYINYNFCCHLHWNLWLSNITYLLMLKHVHPKVLFFEFHKVKNINPPTSLKWASSIVYHIRRVLITSTSINLIHEKMDKINEKLSKCHHMGQSKAIIFYWTSKNPCMQVKFEGPKSKVNLTMFKGYNFIQIIIHSVIHID